MPFYRIHIKLDGQDVREYNIEDPRKDIEYVYQDYKKRVNAKNGTGRVIYFDLVMVAEASLNVKEDREEVFNQDNNYRIKPPGETQVWKKKKRESSGNLPTLGERASKRNNG